MNATALKPSRFEALKIDLHVHTSDDPLDRIRHSARDLIVRAAEQHFDVLAITNHQRLTFDVDLFAFAHERGILLIPGIEVTIQKRHVLLLNPPRGRAFADFHSLASIRRPETLIIAPHPYVPGIHSLNGRLSENRELFDAVEYCHFYSSRVNVFNRKAVEFSRSNGFPLVGNSDAHFLSQLGTTYSLVYAEKNVDSIFAAIRRHRVQVVTRPLSTSEMGSIARRYFNMKIRRRRPKGAEDRSALRLHRPRSRGSDVRSSASAISSHPGKTLRWHTLSSPEL